MSHEDQSYAYTSLRHPDSIRLIKLLPGDKGSPLSCNIVEVRRADGPRYEALSYAWGETTFPHTIEEFITSTHLRITINLHDALQAIRYKHDSRMLWIDAICIDQSDLLEKGHQVASMGKIYGEAWRVVVWLGYHRFVITRIIDILTEIVDAWEENTKAGIIIDFARLERALTRLAASRFLEQPWYTRVWVVQEFILAREVQFRIAGGIVPLALLENVFNALRDVSNSKLGRGHPLDARILGHVPVRSSQLFSYRRKRISRGSEHSDLSLISCVIDLAQGRDCKDTRDRLYAMLAVADDKLGMEPDYTTPLFAVLTQFASQSLRSGDLFVLHASGIRPNHDPSLSSFVPSLADWGGMTLRLNVPELNFCAASMVPTSISSATANSVVLQGVLVDAVKRVLNVAPYINRDEGQTIPRSFIYEGFVSWFTDKHDSRDANIQEHESDSPYTDTSLAKTVFRTMTLDALDVSNLQTEDFTKVYRKEKSKFLRLSLGRLYQNRFLFQTEQGYFGLGPCWMKPDDEVVIFDGGTTPFILRNVKHGNREPGGTWQLVGDCFLLGWMHGDYFGHTVVDELPTEIKGKEGLSGEDKKYLVKEWFALV